MRNVLRAAALSGVLLCGAAAPAHADILFYFNDPGALQPEENLLFNSPGLTLSGLTVQGQTNQTSTLIDITGQEALAANGGQATVSGADGTFTWMELQPSAIGTVFEQFEANLVVYKESGPTPTGTVTVSVTNNFGAVETSSYNVGNGQNYFSLLALDPQMIRSILITSTVQLSNIEQVRVGGVTETQVAPVPEPGTLVLFGGGLLAVGRRFRKSGVA
jgi:hypothetical protein